MVRGEGTLERLGQIHSGSILDNKKLSLVVLFAALIYNILFGFVRNPMAVENTLSWIGYDYPYAFIVWGTLTSAAFFINIFQIYSKFGYTGKIGTVSLYAAPFMAVIVVLINDWGWEGKVHLAAALAFIAFNGIALMAFFIKNLKNHICYKITLFIIGVTLFGMIITYFAIDKSGLLELIPLWGELIILFFVNHTKLYPVIDNEQASPKVRNNKKAAKLAVWFGMLGADDFYFGKYPQGMGHLFMTYLGVIICIVRFIGMGSINDISGEEANIFLAVGLSLICGSAAWAIYNAAIFRNEK